MRFILPVIGAAMALSIGASPAVAQIALADAPIVMFEVCAAAVLADRKSVV